MSLLVLPDGGVMEPLPVTISWSSRPMIHRPAKAPPRISPPRKTTGTPAMPEGLAQSARLWARRARSETRH